MNITSEQLHALAVAYSPDLDWQTDIAGDTDFLSQLFWTKATYRGLTVLFNRSPNHEWCEISFRICQATDDPIWREVGGYPLCEFRCPVDKVQGLLTILPKFGYFVDNFGD